MNGTIQREPIKPWLHERIRHTGRVGVAGEVNALSFMP